MWHIIIPTILYLTYGEAQHPHQANYPVVLNNARMNPLDLEYGSSASNMDTDPRSLVDGESHFEDLELVENFGIHLKNQLRQTFGGHAEQYSALFAVQMALAKDIRNSCSENVNQLYDQVYLRTVIFNYDYGVKNVKKVAAMVEDYIRKGNAHIPRLRKLKQDYCKRDGFCPESFEKKIKSSPLFYMKELETLDAAAHLARSYFTLNEEIDQAAQQGIMLSYLQNNKQRLREHVMHIVNNIEHFADKPVKCK